MLGSIGGPEMLIILVVALIVFGPRRLPELGRSLGRGLSELRRASTDLRDTLEREIRVETPPAPPPANALPPVPADTAAPRD